MKDDGLLAWLLVTMAIATIDWLLWASGAGTTPVVVFTLAGECVNTYKFLEN